MRIINRACRFVTMCVGSFIVLYLCGVYAGGDPDPRTWESFNRYLHMIGSLFFGICLSLSIDYPEDER